MYRCVSKKGTAYLTAKDVKKDRSIIRVNLPDFLDNKVIDELIDKRGAFKRDKKYILENVGHVSWEFVPGIVEKGIRKFISKEQYDRILRTQKNARKIAQSLEEKVRNWTSRMGANID